MPVKLVWWGGGGVTALNVFIYMPVNWGVRFCVVFLCLRDVP